MEHTYDEIAGHFGKQVKKYRTAAKLTGNQLAEKLRTESGVSLEQSGISKIEKGDYTVNLRQIVAFARALNVSVETLLCIPDESDIISRIFDEPVLNRRLRKLCGFFGIRTLQHFINRDLSRLEDITDRFGSYGLEAADSGGQNRLNPS